MMENDIALLLEEFSFERDEDLLHDMESALIETGPPAIDPLITVGSSRMTPASYRERLAAILAEIGWPAVESLVRIVNADASQTSVGAKEYAWMALMQFRNRLAREALRDLLRRLPSPKDALRKGGLLDADARELRRVSRRETLVEDLVRVRVARSSKAILGITGLPPAVSLALDVSHGYSELPIYVKHDDWEWDYDWAVTDLGRLGAEIVEVLVVLIRGTGNEKYTSMTRTRIQRDPFLPGALEEVRTFLTRALDAVIDPAAVRVLVPLLSDVDEDISRAAVRALGRTGAPSAVRPLGKLLSDIDSSLRCDVADALARIGSAEAVFGLVKVLHDDPDESVCGHAARGLVAIASRKAALLVLDVTSQSTKAPGRSTAIDALEAALRDKDIEVRRHVLGALGRWRRGISEVTDALIEPLIESLRDPDEWVCRLAASALGNAKDSRAIQGLISALGRAEPLCISGAEDALAAMEQISFPFLLSIAQNKDAPLRFQAIEAFGVVGRDNGVRLLIGLLHDENADVRKAAATGLRKPKYDVTRLLLDALAAAEDADFRDRIEGVIQDCYQNAPEFEKTRIPRELIQAATDREPAVRLQAVRMLGRIGYSAAFDHLVSRLQDSDTRVRQAATDALGSLRGLDAFRIQRMIQTLISTLRDASLEVVPHIERTLVSIGAPAVELLTEAIRDRSPQVRRSAALVLGYAGSVAVQVLRIALRDPISEVRAQAAESLGIIGGEAVVEDLLGALHDRKPLVRRSAVLAIAATRVERVRPAIEKCLDDDDLEVRACAAETLATSFRPSATSCYKSTG